MHTDAGLFGPALLSGLVAILATVAVERLGGARGGVLASLPSTIVPATWGLLTRTPDAAADALGMVPVGMLINAGFLWTWRVGPPRLAGLGGLPRVLAAQVVASLTAWFSAAAVALLLAAAARRAGASALHVGGVALVVHAALALAATWRPTPAPAGHHPVGPLALLGRGALAAAAITASLVIARSGDGLLAGVAATFPAIFLTTMVGLWLAQGAAVPAGAVGPMMLGAASVSTFALLAAWTAPAFGVVPGIVAAWIAAVACVNVPATAWLGRRAATGPR